ncbi:MAG: PDDEXK nuclease domain-containing protein [Bacilli bacterium]
MEKINNLYFNSPDFDVIKNESGTKNIHNNKNVLYYFFNLEDSVCQIKLVSLLYEILAITSDKSHVIELANNGQTLKGGKDLIKDSFVLNFLNIKENTRYLESDLEKIVLEHLKEFLLELGKGFYFGGITPN